nr:helicase-exonuclease AddAB subunit AddA [uncultured Solibaculum sp.]
MSNAKWTPEQYDAITTRGGSLLVSAAAGSGKTAVLVQRVIERITDEKNPCDIDRLLVVTFTRAAAAEMRGRVAARLTELLSQNPHDPNLHRQKMLLGNARICTVHSFCADLVREHFHLLGIAPDFKLASDAQMALLRQQAAEQTVEHFYELGDPSFSDLADLLGARRADTPLIRVVDRLYEFVRSHPFPEQWMQEKASEYRNASPIRDTKWGKAAFLYAQSAVDYCKNTLMSCRASLSMDAAVDAAFSPSFCAMEEVLGRLSQALEQQKWDACCALLQSASFERQKPIKKGEGGPLKERASAVKKEVSSILSRLQSLFSMSEEEHLEDLTALAPLVDVLMKTVAFYSDTLDALKSDRKLLDFGDLEHLALRILVEPQLDGYRQTQEALDISSRFDEVLVDEYQDTNEAQDMIFRAVSQKEDNLFMVGDVKQSIYRFRQAMPEIFLRRRNEFPPLKDGNFPARITLDRNFRSRKGVTDGVNFVFSQLMSRELGELDYNTEEALVCGANYSFPADDVTEMALISYDSAEDSRDQAEAKWIAARIRRMVDEGVLVSGPDGPRPASYRDFCILLRSKEARAPLYVEQLEFLGIPAHADISGGFFETKEIAAVLSLLRVVDNPLQDIPLLAALMSPIFGFTPDDLADIRLTDQKTSLYSALVQRADTDDKCRRFLDTVSYLRALASTLPADQLILRLYEYLSYSALIQAMPGGDIRRLNLNLLLDYARRFEHNGHRGLSDFIGFLDRLEQSGSDLPPASALPPAADVVRILSIHGSKGLEFPICIVAGCSVAFNRSDVSGSFLLHPELGVGCKRRMPDGRQFTTLPREAVALEIERGFLSEEMRVLYVAMTRAREKLILTMALEDPESTVSALASSLPAKGPIPPFVLRRCKGYSDWLILCALRHPDGQILRELACQPGLSTVQAEGSLRILLEKPPSVSHPAEEETSSCSPDPEFSHLLRQRFGWKYPYEYLSHIPSKLAASELLTRRIRPEDVASSTPAFAEGRPLNAAQRGTVLHAFLQVSDWEKASVHLEDEVNRLVSLGRFSQKEADCIDLNRVKHFFKSPLYRRIIQADKVHKEMQFYVFLPPSYLDSTVSDSGEQQVVLQGVADLVLEEKDGLVLVDYKTDAILDPEILRQRYTMQLRRYAYAMEQVLEKPVKELLLYSFSLGQTIEIPKE